MWFNILKKKFISQAFSPQMILLAFKTFTGTFFNLKNWTSKISKVLIVFVSIIIYVALTQSVP